jgi:hypothetical protein
MNFLEVMACVELVLESGGVPLIIGDSGIGKTALIKRICKEKKLHCVTIDANLLKEGEIGGLPTLEEYEVTTNSGSIKRKRTVYAVHNKLQEIEAKAVKDSEEEIMLFIDEINRCDHAVQQELMNIILNREINGFILPSNVKVVAAMNPSSNFNENTNSNYQVVEMDPAQEDRFVWIEMEADVNSWIKWGMDLDKTYNVEGESNVDKAVLEFITSYPQYLNTPQSTEMVKATPRSWKRVSDSYRVFVKSSDRISNKIFFNVVKGNVGTSIAHEFCNFIENDNKTIISVEEILEMGSITEELKKIIRNESHTKLYLLAKNILNLVSDIEDNKREVQLFSDMLQFYPLDLKIGLMREIKQDYKHEVYKEFLQNETFVNGYFSIFMQRED